MIFICLFIPGDVLHPLIFLVMDIDGGDLDEFVERQNRGDCDDREIPDKGGKCA